MKGDMRNTNYHAAKYDSVTEDTAETQSTQREI